MPKSVDPTQKRAAFVAASWDVIAAEGLRGATLRRVAAEAGCTTGALTHYFSDRRPSGNGGPHPHARQTDCG